MFVGGGGGGGTRSGEARGIDERSAARPTEACDVMRSVAPDASSGVSGDGSLLEQETSRKQLILILMQAVVGPCVGLFV